MTRINHLLVAISFSLLAATASPALADSGTGDVTVGGSAGIQGDVEIDPLAYAFSGHSVHGGFGRGGLRVDIGAFALEVPAFLGGTDGFSTSFDGFGVKLQYFLSGVQRGAFAGVSAGVNNLLVERDDTELAARRRDISAGAQLGYRFAVGERFYATPWIGVDYTFGSDDIMLGGETYERKAVTLFPTIHVGYRFN